MIVLKRDALAVRANWVRLVALTALSLSLLGLASCGASAGAPSPADRTVADTEPTPPPPTPQGWITPPILDDKMGTGG
jgi:hypothetical protein